MLWLIFHTHHPLMGFEFPFNWLSPCDCHQMKWWFGQHYSCNKYFPQGSSHIALLSLSPRHSSGQSCLRSDSELGKVSHFRWFLLIHGFKNWAELQRWTSTRVLLIQGQDRIGTWRWDRGDMLQSVPGSYRGVTWGRVVRPLVHMELHLGSSVPLASSWSWERTCCALLKQPES